MINGDGAESMNAPCPATPAQEEGPYYRRLSLERQEIAEGRPGVPLQLEIAVRDTECVPVPGAVIDIWHCDALGAYSWYAAAAEDEEHRTDEAGSEDTSYICGGAGLAPGTFLRGWQRSDSAGVCRFQSIYPGWYPGRAVHIHVKVYDVASALTTQLYFPDELTDEVHRLAPYHQRPRRDTENVQDVIFRDADGTALVAPIPADDGYLIAATLTVGQRSSPESILNDPLR